MGFSRPDIYDLNVPAGPFPAFGTTLKVIEFTEKTVQVAGTFSGLSMTIEGTIDGTTFEALTGAITDGEIVDLPQTVDLIRVNIAALTTGAPVVKFAGRLARS